MHLSHEAEPALLDLLAALERIGYDFMPVNYGEELERSSYADVERIAAVGAVIERPC